MKVFTHVSRVNVSLWGRRVGTLVELPRQGVYAFRYEKSFLASGVQIAPLMMPLRTEPYAFPDLPRAAYEGLPPETPPEYRRYEQLFVTADELGLGYEVREQIFRRMAFNVLTGEFDDHAKNFSFILKEGASWGFAPAYDLTGSDFPSVDPWSAQANSHQLSVNGKQSEITDGDLLAVADRFAIGTAKRVLDEVRAALKQ